MKKPLLLILFTITLPAWAHAQMGGFSALRDFPALRYAPASSALSEDFSVGLQHHSQAYEGGISRNRSILTAVMPWVDTQDNTLQAGAGLYFMNEQPSDNMGVKMQEVGGSLSYLVRLSPLHDLSFGMGLSWSGIRLNGDGFTTGSQWDPVYGYNPELGQGEDFSGENRDHWSLYSGLIWSALDKKGRELHRLGVNGYRMNQPTGLNEMDQLALDWSAFASVNLWLNNEWRHISKYLPL
ncbi:type IX secretion system membrane protein PorP/SprF [Persicobacter psychrovividus]|uniref:Uncharacterized protein n=1 Tax=Persicobacter psychrovividus TaxID=387638 RepID=A0ABN6L782_9BACT|nr:hypothetical protein PEPS_11310 [Persicobacter psychrovividus]